jgi:hypothetical protein
MLFVVIGISTCSPNTCYQRAFWALKMLRIFASLRHYQRFVKYFPPYSYLNITSVWEAYYGVARKTVTCTEHNNNGFLTSVLWARYGLREDVGISWQEGSGMWANQSSIILGPEKKCCSVAPDWLNGRAVRESKMYQHIIQIHCTSRGTRRAPT